VNYVDVDPTDQMKDFKCNRKGYDGHKGVDFALGSIKQMRAGVDVLAAAAGKVLRVRDGESDRLKTEDELESIKEQKRECGNAVLIDHGDGLQSIYCHMKKDSVIVKPKQRVKAGEKIGQIGQSGVAEFPHLHFGTIWEGGIVDPYTGALNTQGCDQMKAPMWITGLPMEYEPVVIFDGGFRPAPPDFKGIESGVDENPDMISKNSAAFVFWAGFYNVEAGDDIILTVTDPNGEMFVERTEKQSDTRTRQYYFTGRKIGRVQLKHGTYTGRVQIKRGDDIVKEKTLSVVVK